MTKKRTPYVLTLVGMLLAGSSDHHAASADFFKKAGKSIAKGANKVADKGKDTADKGKDAANDLVDKGKDAVGCALSHCTACPESSGSATSTVRFGKMRLFGALSGSAGTQRGPTRNLYCLKRPATQPVRPDGSCSGAGGRNRMERDNGILPGEFLFLSSRSKTPERRGSKD